MINSNIITIGDEILSGHIVDTNAKWLSEKLNNLGVTISKRLTIPDKKKDIKKTIKLSINESDIIILGVPHSSYRKIKIPKNKFLVDSWGFFEK